MHNTKTINLIDLLELIGDEGAQSIISSFSCTLNKEIDSFLKNSAITFAKKKMSVTYLVLDENNELLSYFTLSHKPVLIPTNILSNTSKKKLERYAKLDETTNSYTVSAFLVAQLGKNSAYSGKIIYTGNDLIDDAMSKLSEAQHIVGGGVIFLECEDNEKLLSFYQNEHNNYQIYGERISESENTTYKQLLRFF